ncbi:hypothetical protein [Ensifer sp. ENS10]|uniref:hypothetical protein n=1 Tax=Ensifer sp. ENS10 TaxID=2769286 RepID=UPI0035C84C28
MTAVVGVEEIRLYDIDPRVTEKTLSNLYGSDLTVTASTRAQDAIIVDLDDPRDLLGRLRRLL